jgi:hypothetical protein
MRTCPEPLSEQSSYGSPPLLSGGTVLSSELKPIRGAQVDFYTHICMDPYIMSILVKVNSRARYYLSLPQHRKGAILFAGPQMISIAIVFDLGS